MIGSTIGHFRITSKLGEGGMGAVYRATDNKLGREVAIKVIPPVYADDGDRLARFTREAQVLASLNHPNIATIYGVEENAIVMELVEGPSLSDRLERGALPPEEAFEIARQIAEALEAAHERSVIHRDLKPANIKVTPDGKVKVLDFGLAKLADPMDTPVNGADAPTVVRGNSPTLAGMVMGTAGYMAPEQARGQRVDKRADIWAFGVVLFEMLSGKTAFDGPTVADRMAAVLKTEVDWTALPAHTPRQLKKVIQRCLVRDPKRRFQDITDVRLELEEAEQEVPMPVMAAPVKSNSRYWIAATGIASLIAVGALILPRQRAVTESPMVHFTIPPPTGAGDGDSARGTGFTTWIGVSPDARSIAYSANGGEGLMRIWVRSLDSTTAQPMAGTEGSSWGFWSPDSRSIVFHNGGKLRKADIRGGPPQTVCDLRGTLLGGSWSKQGSILFGTNIAGIFAVPSSGGIAQVVTTLDKARKEWKHSDPTFLPDGKHFLYLRSSYEPANSGIYVGSLDAKPDRQNLTRIAATEFSPQFTPVEDGSDHGYLLYLRDGTLVSHPFDSSKGTVTGEPVTLVEQVATSISRASFSVSTGRVLAYRHGGSAGTAVWMDRLGRVSGGQLQFGNLSSLSLSPDGTRFAYSHGMMGRDGQVWLSDRNGRKNKLSFGNEGGQSPVWSPDGSQVAFASSRAVNLLYRKASNGGGAEQLLYTAAGLMTPLSWSSDGKWLLFATNPGGHTELWLLPDPGSDAEASSRKAVPFLQMPFDLTQGQFSPDMRWVAYTSDETGQFEVYVKPFPATPGDGKWLISTGGGTQPRWRRQGKELYYVTTDGKLMSVEYETRAGFEVKSTKTLFSGMMPMSNNFLRYDATGDGNGFIVGSTQAAETTPMTVVLNWTGLLKK